MLNMFSVLSFIYMFVILVIPFYYFYGCYIFDHFGAEAYA